MLARAGEEGTLTSQELLYRVLVAGGGIGTLLCILLVCISVRRGAITAAIIAAISGCGCVLAAVLASRARKSLAALRGLEILLFCSLLVAIASGGVTPAAGESWLHTEIQLALLLAAYGVLVPNSARRAAVAVAVLTVSSAAIVVTMAARADIDTISIIAALGWLLLAGLIAMGAATLIAVLRDVAVKSRVVNMYDLGDRIGEGGMGEVWRVTHRRLAQPAAMKIVRPERLRGDKATRSATLDQFAREARNTARLRSPHTIQVYDFGVTTNQTFYYVMEHLDGIDLQTLVDDFGPLPSERCVFLLRQACLSLADAHESGLVHRDIKPANLFVCRLGLSFDHVKLLDFGLAVAAGGERDPSAVEGTAAYMAPETIIGDGRFDVRSDIYSLGCVAYYMLTGKMLFDAPDFARMAAAHITQAPPRPSVRAAIEVPAPLEDIVMRCLEKDLTRRFDDARALARALTEVSVPRPWTSAEAEEWWRVHIGPPSSGSLADARTVG